MRRLIITNLRECDIEISCIKNFVIKSLGKIKKHNFAFQVYPILLYK